MTYRLAAATVLLLVSPVPALDGQPGIHDPSTVVLHNGKFYAYGTGNGLPISVSDDGWTWRRAGTLMQALPGGRPGPDVITRGGNNTWAPDVIRVGDRYFVYYAAPGTQPKAAIGLLVGKTLDPDSPDYKWEDGGPVVWSDGVEDINAIDPGVFLDPTNGSLWLTYGSYFGYIRLVELNPKTGNLPSTYVRALLVGLRDALKASRPFSWGRVLAVCEWAVRQEPQDEHPAGNADSDRGWSWCRSAAANLVSLGVDSASIGIPFTDRAQVWRIIEPVTSDPESRA
jgi:Glycosyl hydrolases family 43